MWKTKSMFIMAKNRIRMCKPLTLGLNACFLIAYAFKAVIQPVWDDNDL